METIALKAKTRQEVAHEYGICVKTLNRRFIKEKLNIPPGLIFPVKLKIIYSAFGLPVRLIKP
jgi:hypothetical protein